MLLPRNKDEADKLAWKILGEIIADADNVEDTLRDDSTWDDKMETSLPIDRRFIRQARALLDSIHSPILSR